MHWTCEQMKCMGITYAQMKRSGLNVPIMQHFGFSLLAWRPLQFNKSDAEQLHDKDNLALFGLPKLEVQSILSCRSC